MGRFLIFAMMVMILGSVAGCSYADAPAANSVIDQVESAVQSDHPNEKGVKDARNSGHPGENFGQAFGDFFGNPAWNCFKGTQEGTDGDGAPDSEKKNDDGDGAPDSEKKNDDIMEFTGSCTYQDVKVKVLIQFTLDKENGTFKPTYLSFNDVPQDISMLSALIEKVFGGVEKNF
jgi:hypothetical protein